MPLDLCLKPARFGNARFGASRFGFIPRPELVVRDTSKSNASTFDYDYSGLPGGVGHILDETLAGMQVFYIWRKQARPTTTWTPE